MTVGVPLASGAALAALKPLFALRGTPAFIRSDSGPEFIVAEVQGSLKESGSAAAYARDWRQKQAKNTPPC